MRIAILSAIATLPGEPDSLVAGQQILGRSVIRRQMDAVRLLGCERIICFVHAPRPFIVQAQIEAEKAGSTFHAVTHHRALPGLVTAADELVLLDDGLVVRRDCIPSILADRRGIATLPADPLVLANFERIDAGAAWAGLLIVGGSTVERLMDLPEDSAPDSSLLRIALQDKVPQISLERSLVTEQQWIKITNADAVAAIEQRRAGDLLPPISALAPGIRLAKQLAIHAQMRGIGWVQNPILAAAFIILLSATAFALGYFAGMAWGLALLALVAVIEWMTGFAQLLHIEEDKMRITHRFPIIRALLDGTLIGLIAMPWPVEGEWEPAFAATVLIFGLVVLRKMTGVNYRSVVEDRLPIIVYAILASLFGVLHAAIAVLALAVLVAILRKQPENRHILS